MATEAVERLPLLEAELGTESLRFIGKTKEKVEQIPGAKEKLEAVEFWKGHNTAVFETQEKKLILTFRPDDELAHSSDHIELQWFSKRFHGDSWENSPHGELFVTHLTEGREAGDISQLNWVRYSRSDNPGYIDVGNDRETIELVDKMLDSLPEFFAPTITTITAK